MQFSDGTRELQTYETQTFQKNKSAVSKRVLCLLLKGFCLNLASSSKFHYDYDLVTCSLLVSVSLSVKCQLS